MILVLSVCTLFSKPFVKTLSSALSEVFKSAAAASNPSAAALVETASTLAVLGVQHMLSVCSKFLRIILSSKSKSKGETIDGSFLNIIKGIQGNYNVLPLVSALSNALTVELLQSGKANVKPTEEAFAAHAVLATRYACFWHLV